MLLSLPIPSFQVVRYIFSSGFVTSVADDEFVVWVKVDPVNGSSRTPTQIIIDFISLYNNV
jgi:hypothetical protein